MVTCYKARDDSASKARLDGWAAWRGGGRPRGWLAAWRPGVHVEDAIIEKILLFSLLGFLHDFREFAKHNQSYVEPCMTNKNNERIGGHENIYARQIERKSR